MAKSARTLAGIEGSQATWAVPFWTDTQVLPSLWRTSPKPCWPGLSGTYRSAAQAELESAIRISPTEYPGWLVPTLEVMVVRSAEVAGRLPPVGTVVEVVDEVEVVLDVLDVDGVDEDVDDVDDELEDEVEDDEDDDEVVDDVGAADLCLRVATRTPIRMTSTTAKPTTT